jgi:hypothetical protein
MQRLAMDVSGVVAFIRVTEWSRQVLKVVCGRRLPCFHHLCTAWANNPYRIIFVTVPVTGSSAREDRLVRDLCIFLSTRIIEPPITITFPRQVCQTACP